MCAPVVSCAGVKCIKSNLLRFFLSFPLAVHQKKKLNAFYEKKVHFLPHAVAINAETDARTHATMLKLMCI